MTSVLLVDDSENILDTVSEMLSDHGYLVKTSSDYETARRILEEGGIDLIICDLELPTKIGADGEEGVTTVETGENAIPEFHCDFPGIPILAISGAISEQGLARMKRFGAVDILGKPFSETQLIEALKRIKGTDSAK